MEKIVISVDMAYASDLTDAVRLTKVVDALGEDITALYAQFCETNGFDLSNKSEIENAAIPFIKKFETLLP